MSTATKITVGAVVLVMIAGAVWWARAPHRGASSTSNGSPESPAPNTAIASDESPPVQAPPAYGPDGVDQYGWTRELSEAASPMKMAGMTLMQATFRNNGQYPRTLGASLPLFKRPMTPTQVASLFLTPAEPGPAATHHWQWQCSVLARECRSVSTMRRDQKPATTTAHPRSSRAQRHQW